MSITKLYSQPPLVALPRGLTHCVLETDLGSIKVLLTPERSPRAVNNFVYLVRQGFYDGLPFHRLVPGFIAQTGCPAGTGTGDAGFHFTGELPPVGSSYGFGDVAFASRGLRDGSASQFFVCLADLPALEPHYPLIGHVVETSTLIRFNGLKSDTMGKPEARIRLNRARLLSTGP